MPKKLQAPKRNWPILSESEMLIRDAFIEKIRELWDVEKEKPKSERTAFTTILRTVAENLRYPSYFAVPDIIRSAIGRKMAAERVYKKINKELKRVHKRQTQLKFILFFDPEPVRPEKSPPDDPFLDLWEGYVVRKERGRI